MNPANVIVEFGHNDGGSISSSDRAEVGGESLTDSQTVVLANGTSEVIYTFAQYVSPPIILVSQVLTCSDSYA